MWIVMVAASLAVACAGDAPEQALEDTEQTPASLPNPAANVREIIGAESFLLLEGNDTVSVERFDADAGQVRGQLRNAAGATVRYTATVDEAGRVTRLELLSRLLGDADESQEEQTIVTLEGDSVLVETRRGGTTEFSRFPADGAMPYITPSLGLLQQALASQRAASANGGGEVTLFVLGEGGAGQPARIDRLGVDSVRVVLPGDTLRLQIDAQGRILGGTNASGTLVIARGPAG